MPPGPLVALVAAAALQPAAPVPSSATPPGPPAVPGDPTQPAPAPPPPPTPPVPTPAPAEATAIAIVVPPILVRYVPASEKVLLLRTLVDVARVQGMELTPIEDQRTAQCWGSEECYQRAARATGAPLLLAIEAVRTRSGRLNLTVRLLDGSGRILMIERTSVRPDGLGKRLPTTAVALRAAAERHLPPPPPPPPAPAPSAAPPPPPPPVVAAPSQPAWYQEILVNVFLSTAATYNLNRPPGKTNQFRAFDFDDESLKLDVAELVIERAAAGPGDAGVRFDFTAGSSIPRVAAARGLFRDAMGNAGDFDLQQAFLSYIVPLGRGLRLDAGKFVTHTGLEIIEGFDGYNDNYSHSFLFTLAIPFTHTGLRASYPLGERLTLSAMLANGWDNVRDDNAGKTVGGQIALVPTTDLTLVVSYLGGPEQPRESRRLRHVAEAVAIFKLRVPLTISINALHGWEERAVGPDRDSKWRGAVLGLRLDATRRLTLAGRAEIFDDPQGARTGLPQRLVGLTLTPAVRLRESVTVRGEIRHDRSSEATFAARTGMRDQQLTLALNAIYAQ